MDDRQLSRVIDRAIYRLCTSGPDEFEVNQEELVYWLAVVGRNDEIGLIASGAYRIEIGESWGIDTTEGYVESLVTGMYRLSRIVPY